MSRPNDPAFWTLLAMHHVSLRHKWMNRARAAITEENFGSASLCVRFARECNRFAISALDGARKQASRE